VGKLSSKGVLIGCVVLGAVLLVGSCTTPPADPAPSTTTTIDESSSSTTTSTTTTEAPPAGPTVSINVTPTEARVASTGGSVTFSVTAEVDQVLDPGGAVSSVQWAFSDGTTQTTEAPGNTALFTASLTKVFSPSFSIITRPPGWADVFAVSTAGAVSETVRVPVLFNRIPTAAFDWTTSGANPWSVTFTNQSTDSDGTIVGISWNFGVFAGTGSASPITRTLYGGNHPVTLTVTDSDGETATITRTVSLAGGLPSVEPWTRERLTGTSGRYTWVGVPGATGYEFDYEDKSSAFCGGGWQKRSRSPVLQPGLTHVGSTITAIVSDTDTVCAERIRMRAYADVNGTRYYGPWTGYYEW
jgi:hypothetical protein